MIGAVADVLDIIVLGTAGNLTQQTLALCTNTTTQTGTHRFYFDNITPLWRQSGTSSVIKMI